MSFEPIDHSNISDEEFIRRFMAVYDEYLRQRETKDFEVNPDQMQHFTDLVKFFTDEANQQDGWVEPLDIQPSAETCGITASFLVFDLHGEKVRRFCDVLRFCSAVGIEATTEGEVIIDCTIPYCFRPKAQD